MALVLSLLSHATKGCWLGRMIPPSVPQPDLSLTAMLRRIAMFTRSWPGEGLDAERCVRGVNLGAAAVPVFWCFNAQEEFAALATALGPEQPVVGMRSLNQIIETSPATRPALDEVAQHYAATLIARFGTGRCIVGGNCQAAGMAWRVAMQLWLAGVTVLRLVTLDAEMRVPFPGHVRLLFGAKSSRHNPFLSPPEDAQRPLPWHWQRAYAGCDWDMLPADHGFYFVPPALPALAEAILRPHPALPPRPALAAISWRIAAEDSSGLTIEAAPPAALPPAAELAVLPVWQAANGGLVRCDGADWVVPVLGMPVPQGATGVPPLMRARIPRQHAAVRLVPVLCAKGLGPLDWP